MSNLDTDALIKQLLPYIREYQVNLLESFTAEAYDVKSMGMFVEINLLQISLK